MCIYTPADILVGLLRLRKCSGETFRPELKGGVSVVRELHVYGSVVPVNARDPSKFQHQVCLCSYPSHIVLSYIIQLCVCAYTRKDSHVIHVLTCTMSYNSCMYVYGHTGFWNGVNGRGRKNSR